MEHNAQDKAWHDQVHQSARRIAHQVTSLGLLIDEPEALDDSKRVVQPCEELLGYFDKLLQRDAATYSHCVHRISGLLGAINNGIYVFTKMSKREEEMDMLKIVKESYSGLEATCKRVFDDLNPNKAQPGVAVVGVNPDARRPMFPPPLTILGHGL